MGVMKAFNSLAEDKAEAPPAASAPPKGPPAPKLGDFFGTSQPAADLDFSKVDAKSKDEEAKAPVAAKKPAPAPTPAPAAKKQGGGFFDFLKSDPNIQAPRGRFDHHAAHQARSTQA